MDYSLCTETFSSKINLKQHMRNVYKTKEQLNLCCNCGKISFKKETKSQRLKEPEIIKFGPICKLVIICISWKI